MVRVNNLKSPLPMAAKQPPLGLSLALISGKGGSGKTVVGLAMARILTEAGYSVLLIDCDTSTHGATYFFENDLERAGDVLTLAQLMRGKNARRGTHLFKAKDGFSFMPSTLRPAEDQDVVHGPTEDSDLYQRLHFLRDKFDITIFDCQAGYNAVVRGMCEMSRRHLIVMEPDAVSSAAVRVLFLQLGNLLKSSSTWQVFNKLTEEERPAYSKVMAGTLFTNLPAVPFDWSVRAAFAIKEIPSVMSAESAFGLGLMRLAHIILPECRDRLQELEQKTIGEWYANVLASKERAETLLASLRHEQRGVTKISRALNALPDWSISTVLAATLALALSPNVLKIFDIELSLAGALTAFVVLSLTIALVFKFRSAVGNGVSKSSEKINAAISTMEHSLHLLRTDPRLVEYQRLHPEKAKEAIASEKRKGS